MVRPVLEEEKGLKILCEPAAATDTASTIDIVAIHGIGAHPDDTWTAKDERDGHYINWLTDERMLPRVVPYARIMRYGYESQWFGKEAMNVQVADIADRLLKQLRRKRKEYPYRPLIFICHCFGGLVVLEALNRAHSDEEEWPGTYKSTAGLAFFGTPFRGAGGLSQTDMVVAALRQYRVDEVQGDTLRVLQAGDPHLRSITDAFGRLQSKANKIPAACFYETKSSDVGGIVGGGKRYSYAVDRDSGCLDLADGVSKHSLSRTHFDMNKFKSPTEEDYETVEEELKKLADGAHARVAARQQTRLSYDAASSASKQDEDCKAGPYRPFGIENFVSTVPSSKVKHYVQRPDLFHQLKTELHAKLQESGENSYVVGVCGLGGAGKTQLVLDYIQRQQKDYKGLYWIDARSQISVERGLALLYRILYQLPATSEAVAFDEVLVRVKAWFSGHSGQQDRWLLVFDNADNIEDEDGEDYVDLRSLIPPAACLHVIVTTRNSKMTQLSDARPVYVGGLEVDEALKLFWMRSDMDGDRASPKSKEYAKDIVEAVGRLALAVELAAATVLEERAMKKDLSLYLAAYRANRQELLDRRPDRVASGYDRSILAAWETTFGYVSRKSLLAAKLLGFLTVLDPTDIYVDLFAIVLDEESRREDHRRADVSVQQKWTTVLAPNTVMTMRLLERALSVLESFSLLRYDEEGEAYSMHRLIHDWGLERLGRGERVAMCQAATELIVSYIEQCGTDPNVRSRVVKHVSESVRICQSNWSHFPDEVSSGLLEDFLLFEEHTDSVGRWKESETVKRFVFSEKHRILGDEHPDTISAMSNLAITLGNQGKLDEAASMMEEVLEKMRRILGDEHPNTVSAMNNLANTLGEQGKLDEAASMKKEVLEKRRRILGDEHPDTISAMNNLANTLGDQGKLDEAASMKKEVLEKRRRILGDEHPDTISAMHNLANTLGEQGKLDEAASMKKEVLEKMRRILGDEHPDTISAISNLASTLGEQGKLDEAASMKKEVLEKRRRILGDEHPDTISAMNNLANTLGDQGKLDEAASMMEEVLEKMRRILGDEHPDTISAMSNLAITLGDQGKLDEAASMRKEVLEKRRRILGDEHPDTISAISNLASTLGEQGKLDEAASMKKEVLEKRRRILGDEHPDTISAMSNLAITLGDQGKLDEAASMKKEVLEKRRRILGDEHPNTVSAMSNLANTLGEQGKLDEAASMMEEVLEKRRRILGDEHPNTRVAQQNLAVIQQLRNQRDVSLAGRRGRDAGSRSK